MPTFPRRRGRHGVGGASGGGRIRKGDEKGWETATIVVASGARVGGFVRCPPPRLLFRMRRRLTVTGQKPLVLSDTDGMGLKVAPQVADDNVEKENVPGVAEICQGDSVNYDGPVVVDDSERHNTTGVNDYCAGVRGDLNSLDVIASVVEAPYELRPTAATPTATGVPASQRMSLRTTDRMKVPRKPPDGFDYCGGVMVPAPTPWRSPRPVRCMRRPGLSPGGETGRVTEGGTNSRCNGYSSDVPCE